VTEDQLAELAVAFATRVRTEDPDDNADWLLAATTETDRWRLLFVLAAAVVPDGFERATAWARRPPEEFVDEIAVERACRGEAVALNRLERRAVVATLVRRGQLSLREIAARAGMDKRSVTRAKAALRERRAS
jgi:hypothetical protein